MSDPLVTDLLGLEAVIERGLATFVEVGQALMRIRDERKYKDAGWLTFEEYCRNRWGWDRSRAYQIIDAAKMSTVVDIETERQARELMPLKNKPDKVREIWNGLRDESVETGEPITASKVREAVQRETSEKRAAYKPPDIEPPRPLVIELDEKHWKQLLSVAKRHECRPESAANALLQTALEKEMRRYVIGA